MSPCTRNHCPSTKQSCQRPSCTLALRNRLERRRVERDHLQAKVKAERISLLKSILKIAETCDDIEKETVARVRKDFERDVAKPIGPQRCFCAACAVGYKESEIFALQENFRALQASRRAMEGVQKRCRRRAETASV